MCGESCFDLLDIPESFEGEDKPVKEEQFLESGENVFDDSFIFDTPFVPARELPVLDDGLFLNTDDLLNQMEPNPSSFGMPDEYLKYFESADSNSEYSFPENATLTHTESQVAADELLPTAKLDKQIETTEMEHFVLPDVKGNDVASSSNQFPEDTKFDSDYMHPFIGMLGKKSSPYSFSTKDASLRLTSSSHSPSSIHVTAGMVQIRNTDSFGNRLSWSFDKNGNIEVVLSHALPQGDASDFEMLANLLAGKASSALIVFWVLIISISFKIASPVDTANC